MQPANELAEVRRAPPLAEQIYLQLKQSLRTGAASRRRERLVDAALAQQLNVSRTPVREAFSRLTADGLLETKAGGFQVVTPTAEDMTEIFELRRLLEPPAARQAARRMATCDDATDSFLPRWSSHRHARSVARRGLHGVCGGQLRVPHRLGLGRAEPAAARDDPALRGPGRAGAPPHLGDARCARGCARAARGD